MIDSEKYGVVVPAPAVSEEEKRRQAAIVKARAKARRDQAEEDARQRRAQGQTLTQNLGDLLKNAGLKVPAEKPKARHAPKPQLAQA